MWGDRMDQSKLKALFFIFSVLLLSNASYSQSDLEPKDASANYHREPREIASKFAVISAYALAIDLFGQNGKKHIKNMRAKNTGL